MVSRPCLLVPLTIFTLVHISLAKCGDPTPAFPLPNLRTDDDVLANTFESINRSLDEIISDPQYINSSFSVEVTSSKQSLWSHHYTSPNAALASPRGTDRVNSSSIYRIASISKVFTVLGLLYQHRAGNLSLDTPVNHYLSALNESSQAGHIPWHSITIRSLASQLSGIPRESLQGDIINDPETRKLLHLPDLKSERDDLDLPQCDEYQNYKPPCGAEEFLRQVKKGEPLFAPNWKSSYSNDAFDLLGLVLANVSGVGFDDYVRTTIFEPLNLTHTSTSKPKDTLGAIPPIPFHFWNISMGVQNPTGGIYTSSADLSTFLRYILTHYNALTPSLNWLAPASYSANLNSFYGTPWEIFRTTSILPSTNRPVTFVTKSGGLPGYSSLVALSAEHDLGITILVAGNGALLNEVRERVTVPLIRAADKLAMRDLEQDYGGTYSVSSASATHDRAEKTSLTLHTHLHSGLTLTDFIINNTDIIAALGSTPLQLPDSPHARLQLTPTLLYVDEERKCGERWRIEPVSAPEDIGGRYGGVWDEQCIVNEDVVKFAGRGWNEIVFWREEEGEGGVFGRGVMREVELRAWRIRLRRETGEDGVGRMDEAAVEGSLGVLGGSKDGLAQSILGKDW